jgi:hypothetical protein
MIERRNGSFFCVVVIAAQILIRSLGVRTTSFLDETSFSANAIFGRHWQ